MWLPGPHQQRQPASLQAAGAHCQAAATIKVDRGTLCFHFTAAVAGQPAAASHPPDHAEQHTLQLIPAEGHVVQQQIDNCPPVSASGSHRSVSTPLPRWEETVHRCRRRQRRWLPPLVAAVRAATLKMSFVERTQSGACTPLGLAHPHSHRFCTPAGGDRLLHWVPDSELPPPLAGDDVVDGLEAKARRGLRQQSRQVLRVGNSRIATSFLLCILFSATLRPSPRHNGAASLLPDAPASTPGAHDDTVAYASLWL